MWGEQMQTITYRMDKQGPSIKHRELHSICYDKPLWKRVFLKMYINSIYMNLGKLQEIVRGREAWLPSMR